MLVNVAVSRSAAAVVPVDELLFAPKIGQGGRRGHVAVMTKGIIKSSAFV